MICCMSSQKKKKKSPLMKDPLTYDDGKQIQSFNINEREKELENQDKGILKAEDQYQTNKSTPAKLNSENRSKSPTEDQSQLKRKQSIKSPYFQHVPTRQVQNDLDDVQSQKTQKSTKTRGLIQSVGFKNKGAMVCKFCFGKSCKHEDWTRCTNPAIRGLHSQWVMKRFVAAQRPSDRLIKDYDIINQFKENNLGAIFNLQEPGEHPSCGDGINPQTGFSYTPETFMNNGISFFNFHWKDMTLTNNNMILSICHQIDVFIQKGQNVFVHCHAGLGRTATVIAAYLVYSAMAKDGFDSVRILKEQRTGSFNRSAQSEYVSKVFPPWVKEQRVVFPTQQKRLSLVQIIYRQNDLLHGQDRIQHRFLPKVLNLSVDLLRKALQPENIQESEKDIQINILNIFEKYSDGSCDRSKQVETVTQQINSGQFEQLQEANYELLIEIVIEFLIDMEEFTFTHFMLQNLQFSELDLRQRWFVTLMADFARVLVKVYHNLKEKQDQILTQLADLIVQRRDNYTKDMMVLLQKLVENLKDSSIKEIVNSIKPAPKRPTALMNQDSASPVKIQLVEEESKEDLSLKQMESESIKTRLRNFDSTNAGSNSYTTPNKQSDNLLTNGGQYFGLERTKTEQPQLTPSTGSTMDQANRIDRLQNVETRLTELPPIKTPEKTVKQVESIVEI